MALVTCKECKNHVSDSAKTCPSCGAAVPKSTSRLAIFIAGMFGLIVLSSIFRSNSTPTPEPTPKTAISTEAVKSKLDCTKNEAEILTFVNSRIVDYPNSALETLRPCATETNNPTYIAKITEAEKNIKINQKKDIDRLVQLEKDSKNFAKEEAKRKKSQGVELGMTAEDVVASAWGKPERINKTTTATTYREQWVYGSRNYLYFVNGKLTTIQN